MKPSTRKLLFLTLGCLLNLCAVTAQPILRLPAVIGDHMVLQAQTSARIWGWADPNTTVTLTPSWGEPVTVKAGLDTRWSVELMTPAASDKPQRLQIATKKCTRTIEDILIGQLWLCSGQSNMNWSAANGILDMRQELQTAMPQQIRLFTVAKNSTSHPQQDCAGKWEVCTPQSAEYFSAVGYFFGKRLHEVLQQPVGLINASWGGTPVEVWTPQQAMTKQPAMIESWKAHPKNTPGWQIGSLYNAMIEPLLPSSLAGVIWYQGESNKENGKLYAAEFGLMIDSWRKAFGAQLPFYFVQIAPCARAEGQTAGAIVREQQARVAATTPKTGMVVISDLVDDITDIHPRYKKSVGDRLANWALGELYGKTGIKYKHATLRGVEFKRSQAIVSFDNAEGGLRCNDASINGLEICDASMKFTPAQGMLDAKTGTLVVWSKQVSRPMAVRYCFSDDAIGNIFDAAGLPVAPFRSDADDAAAPARLPDPAVSQLTVTASGKGFEVRPLAVGTSYFLNREYPISAMPERFAGMQMLAHAATNTDVQHCKVSVREQGRIYIAVRRNSTTSAALAGWKPERNAEIRYTTREAKKPGILSIFYKDVKAGQSIALPETTDFAGVSLLAAKIEYTK